MIHFRVGTELQYYFMNIEYFMSMEYVTYILTAFDDCIIKVQCMVVIYSGHNVK